MSAFSGHTPAAL